MSIRLCFSAIFILSLSKEELQKGISWRSSFDRLRTRIGDKRDCLEDQLGAIRDPAWQGIAVLEAYLFAAFVYLVFSWGMGAYSRFLERRFRTGDD